MKTKLIKKRGKIFVRPCKTFLRPPPYPRTIKGHMYWVSFHGRGSGVLYIYKNWFKQELVEFELLHNFICTPG